MTDYRTMIRSKGVLLAAAGTAGIGAAVMLARASRGGGGSVPMMAMRLAIRVTTRDAFATADRVRRQVENRASPVAAPLPASIRRICEITEDVVNGCRVLTLSPRGDRTSVHILYHHGGAFINPLISWHWRALHALIEATGATVTVPLYPLAPEHDHIPATALVDAVYERIAAPTDVRVVLAGDSAGGNMALTQALRRREAGLPLPDRILLFAPWLDLALRDPATREVEPDDDLLAVDGLRACGRWWAGACDPACPAMSPLYADLRDLPPIALFQGDRDIFVVDSRTFARRCAEAGVRCDYHEVPGAFHVFNIATFTPEAKAAYAAVARFFEVRSNVGVAKPADREGV